jgi:hypothetical protein
VRWNWGYWYFGAGEEENWYLLLGKIQWQKMDLLSSIFSNLANKRGHIQNTLLSAGDTLRIEQQLALIKL